MVINAWIKNRTEVPMAIENEIDKPGSNSDIMCIYFILMLLWKTGTHFWELYVNSKEFGDR